MALNNYKILYIGTFGKNSTEKHIADELERQGCKVYKFSKNEDSRLALNVSKKVDLVMFSKLPPRWKLFMDKVETKTCCWIFDVYPFNERTLDEQQFRADIVYSTGGVEDSKILRQAIDEPQKQMFNYDKIYDIVFVGSIYGEHRAKLDEFLLQNYAGRYYQIGDKNEIRGTDLNHILGQTKIVVGDSYPKDYYWSNRVYEITGRGGFLLHPHVKGMDDEWIDKKHLAYYNYKDFDDLKEKIDYYLENEEEREQIRKQGFNHCPTYKKRIQELLCNLY